MIENHVFYPARLETFIDDLDLGAFDMDGPPRVFGQFGMIHVIGTASDFKYLFGRGRAALK